MKIDIVVPAAGESVTEADIASWSKSDGELVDMDDVLHLRRHPLHRLATLVSPLYSYWNAEIVYQLRQ